MARKTSKRHAPSASDEDLTKIARSYVDIRKDYTYDGSVFTQDPERVARLKWIIENRLTQVDQTLIILYADCGSLRDLGKRLGLSHTLVGKEIRRIRALILEEYAKLENQ